MVWGGGESAMGEGLQWFFSNIADLPGGGGEGLQYNTGSRSSSDTCVVMGLTFEVGFYLAWQFLTAPQICQYAISQLRIVLSGLYLVTYLDVGNFCDKAQKQLYMKFVFKFS